MTKYESFMQALEKLCLEHKVSISSSYMDLLQVWDLDPEDDLTRELDYFEDKTKESKK